MNDNDMFLKFKENYPVIFREEPRCGFYIPEGWVGLLENLAEDLTRIAVKGNITVAVDQVKVKYGGLRFYYTLPDDLSLVEYRSKDLVVKPKQPCSTLLLYFRKVKYQIKTAFSMLKFRYPFLDRKRKLSDKLYDTVRFYESMSYLICSTCGRCFNRVRPKQFSNRYVNVCKGCK